MNKILKLFFIGLTLFFMTNKVFALTVSDSNITMAPGTTKEIELSTNSDEELSSIEFTLVYSTYDIPANFVINSIYTDSNPNGIKHIIYFDTPVSGNINLGTVRINTVKSPKETAGTINIHSAKATTTTGTTINLDSQNINITIGEETTPKEEDNKVTNTNNDNYDKNMLKEIKSDKVKINLIKDTFDYEVTIDPTLEELDLEPITINNNYKVTISTQKISDLEDNKITITVEDTNKHTSTYNIKVNILKDIEDVSIDSSQYKENKSYQGKWLLAIIFFGIVLFISLIFTKKGK